MSKINVLDSSVYNRIAAGEVVENPRSIVKELIENAIDAGADKIIIDIRGGGIEFLRVSDNGSGVTKDDMPLAFLPHATSKIKDLSDLDAISSLGFRGEALASIASVAAVTMISRCAGDELGNKIVIEQGVTKEHSTAGCSFGTSVTVERLFANVPARAKFLRKIAAEEADICELVIKLILANPRVAFKLTTDGKIRYQTSGNGAESAIYSVYGGDMLSNLERIQYQTPDFSLFGYVSKPHFSKHNRNYQTLIVNHRYVTNTELSYVIQQCYSRFLMKRQFPVYVLYLDVPCDTIDVNVHPNKMEVRFVDFKYLRGIIYAQIKKVIESCAFTPGIIGAPERGIDVVEYAPVLPGEATQNVWRVPDKVSDATQNNNPRKEIGRMGDETKIRVSGADTVGRSYPNAFDSIISLREPTELEVKLAEMNRAMPSNLESLVAATTDAEGMPHNNVDGLPDKDGDRKDTVYTSALSKENQCAANNQELGQDNDYNNNQQGNTQIFDIAQNLSFLPEESIEPIGRLFKTYIIVQLGNSAFLIDQHAAHEKLLYDRLKNKFDNKTIVEQSLLVPYVFELLPSDVILLENRLNDLSECGFQISQLSGGAFAVNALPLECAQIDMKSFIDGIMSDIRTAKSTKSFDLLRDKIMQTACKAAVKGEDELSAEEIRELLRQMKKEGSELFCPHGRPTVLELKRSEIEKWFKRIV